MIVSQYIYTACSVSSLGGNRYISFKKIGEGLWGM